ncbi:ATP-binding protein, partial [Salmonella enterica subsp. enterica serovar Brandenburg]|uniref:ATP-binding protein n=1 Tax=Salmonella enterica TaxID=28901 RepID=UPI0039E906F4
AMVDVSRRELRVSTRLTPGGFVEVSIADSGTVIAPEIWPRLFDAFVSGKADGMGLGLSICRTIIEAHGGRIWAEQPPDGGTIFLFTLI